MDFIAHLTYEFLFLDVVLVSSKREIISFVNGISACNRGWVVMLHLRPKLLLGRI